MKTPTLGPCSCRPGIGRDNCPTCEGTGQRIDFAAIRAHKRPSAPALQGAHTILPNTGLLVLTALDCESLLAALAFVQAKHIASSNQEDLHARVLSLVTAIYESTEGLCKHGYELVHCGLHTKETA